jgi:hypothetical protein
MNTESVVLPSFEETETDLASEMARHVFLDARIFGVGAARVHDVPTRLSYNGLFRLYVPLVAPSPILLTILRASTRRTLPRILHHRSHLFLCWLAEIPKLDVDVLWLGDTDSASSPPGKRLLLD